MMNKIPMFSATDVHTYTLTFAGVLDDDFLTSFCPEGTVATAVDQHTTLTNLCTDQSGIIGVIRRLHNLGCTLISLSTKQGSSARLAADSRPAGVISND